MFATDSQALFKALAASIDSRMIMIMIINTQKELTKWTENRNIDGIKKAGPLDS